MKTKHTPGPWVVSDKNIMEMRNGKFICSAYNIGVAEEQRANAQIIAAAPELLEALEHLVGYEMRDTDVRTTMGEWRDMMAAAQKAIDKAKGENR